MISVLTQLGRGAKRVSEDIVRSVEQPDFTKTWHPYSHGVVLDTVSKVLDQRKLQILDRSYSTSRSLEAMFGLWQLNVGGQKNGLATTEASQFSLGIRNSINKTLSIGFCAIKFVVRCFNQISTGSFILLRKHTGTLNETVLLALVDEAVEKTIGQFKSLNEWHENLRDHKLSYEKSCELVVRALRQHVLAPRNYDKFDGLYFGAKEEKPIYSPDLYGFHGALTEVIKNNSHETIAFQNRMIYAFMQSVQKDQ